MQWHGGLAFAIELAPPRLALVEVATQCLPARCPPPELDTPRSIPIQVSLLLDSHHLRYRILPQLSLTGMSALGSVGLAADIPEWADQRLVCVLYALAERKNSSIQMLPSRAIYKLRRITHLVKNHTHLFLIISYSS